MTDTNIVTENKVDWHPAQVVCALKMKGWSVRGLSVHHGYSPITLQVAVSRKWPKGERIIAETLEMNPEDIWPSRYDDNKPETRGRKTAIEKLPKHLANGVDSRLDKGCSITEIFDWLSQFNDNNMSKRALCSHAKRYRSQS